MTKETLHSRIEVYVKSWGEAVAVRRPEGRGMFLDLSDVTIQCADGGEERLPTAYINKATIQLAATSDADAGRGIGAKAGHKPYPFVDKLAVPVRLRMPAYALSGSMHCASGQRAWHVLEERLMFLPHSRGLPASNFRGTS